MGSEQRAGNIRVPARLVALGLCLVLGATSLFAQDRPPITMELSDSLVTQGERITLELFVPGADPDELSLLLPSLPSRLAPLGEPLLTESRRLVNNAVLSGTLIILQLQAGSPGRTVLPPLRVEGLGMEPIETAERLIEISFDGSREGVPFDLQWRIDDSQLLVGETRPVYLEMANILDLRYPDGIDVDSPSSGVFEEVRGLGEVRSREVEETTLYTVPVAVFLVTPTQEGRLRVPAASVSLDDLTRQSAVLDLAATTPADQPSSGAVGNFDFSYQLSQEEGEVVDTLTVTLTVSGAGNLPFISFPSLELENFIEVDRREEIRQVPSEEGYEGERSIVLRLSPGEGTEARVTVSPFDYFDPTSGRLVVLPGETFSYSLPAPGTAEAPGGVERALQLVSPEEILAAESGFSHRDSSSYLLFLIGPGILLVIAVAMVLQRRGAPPTLSGVILLLGLVAALPLIGQNEAVGGRLRGAARLFETGAYQEALSAYRSLTEELPYNGELYHNLGIAAYFSGSRGEAVHGLREAVRYAQDRREFRELLLSLEEEYGLERQVEVPRFLDPDTALIGLLLLFNVGLPLVVLLPFKAKGKRVIAVTLFFILTGMGTLVFLQARHFENQPRGVVRAPEARMLRIPEPDADTWLSLPEGSAVQVELRHEEFVLVRTGVGVEGWLEAEQLFLGANENG